MLRGIRLFLFDLGQLKANLSLSEHESVLGKGSWYIAKESF